MKIERDGIEEQLVYEIMYFSPIQVGDERYINQLYFQTDIYNRTWPQSMADKMSAQIEELRHVELDIQPFDAAFKKRHRDAVLFHCKMALAYLDSREARIAMKLCEACHQATGSSESRILQDPGADFDFMRITMLTVMACASRRVKFYQKAVDALSEAKNICLQEGKEHQVHPMMTALTLLNLSAVLGDIDHDEHGLRWGLEALAMMYTVFASMDLPQNVQAYYLTVACHNAALLNVKLGRWADAVELVNEGIEFTKILGENDDGLRKKLIAIGAQAKQVPEGFLAEAANALNGWGEERGTWNLSFWDFTEGEIREEVHVLKNTATLKHLIIENLDTDRRCAPDTEDPWLCELVLAILSCQSLEKVTVGPIDFDPRKVWRRIKKRSFLETSWYATGLNFQSVSEMQEKPTIAVYRNLLKNLNPFIRKIVMFLVVIGNECEGVDLSENGITVKSITALVYALRWRQRPSFTREVSTVILSNNNLDPDAAGELAKTWAPDSQDPHAAMIAEASAAPLAASNFATIPEDQEDDGGSKVGVDQQGVTSLDVSQNGMLGDRGLEALTAGIGQSPHFKVLRADSISLGPAGCRAVEMLSTTRIELLCLSNNEIGSEGAEVVCRAAMKFPKLAQLHLDNCSIDGNAAETFSLLLENHEMLRNISLNNNRLGNDGAIQFCHGAAKSRSLKSVHIACNGIECEHAAVAIGDMMRQCESLLEMNLSGNRIEPKGAPHIGSAIEHSKILTMYLEDMGFTEHSIDDFLDNGAAETQDLQVMILNNNPVGDEGLGIIAECLSIGLTELSLSGCGLTSASQATLLNLVSLSPKLRSLDLSNNNIGPDGCADMVLWMTQNEKDHFSLRSLELSNCGLGDDGLFQLVPILGSLLYLGARKNGITSAGLEAVMNSNHMIQLKSLDLADNNIGEAGVHALTERFQQETKRSLWNPKQLTSTIDQVILSNNAITPGVAQSTEAFLKIHNPLLTVVW